MQKNSLVLTLAVVPFLAASSRAAETVSAYLSAPYTQSATDSGATSGAGYNNAVVETFDETGMMTGSFTTLTTASPTASPAGIGGTFTSNTTSNTNPNSIDATGQYGGGGQGQYLGVGGTVTLTFSSPVMYLGLFWCAVDNGNSATFYDQNGGLLGTYNAATFANLLPNSQTATVTAINGSTYNTINYFGQPTGNASTDPTIGNRKNSTQQYAYLNFIPGGTTAGGAPTEIGKVVLNENNGATFESDNYAVLSSSTTPLGSFVPAGTVPEPSTWATMLGGTALLGTVLRHRRVRG